MEQRLGVPDGQRAGPADDDVGVFRQSLAGQADAAERTRTGGGPGGGLGVVVGAGDVFVSERLLVLAGPGEPHGLRLGPGGVIISTNSINSMQRKVVWLPFFFPTVIFILFLFSCLTAKVHFFEHKNKYE